jgi:hypothetical protein
MSFRKVPFQVEYVPSFPGTNQIKVRAKHEERFMYSRSMSCAVVDEQENHSLHEVSMKPSRLGE